VLSTDDEESSDEETNIDELGKDLESMLSKKKTMEQINLEREEAERRDLQKLLNQEAPQPSTPPAPDKQEDLQADATGRRLIIRRKFSTETGYYFREEEIVRPEVIDAYLKIKETADKTNKRFLIDNLDEQQKDEVRKERRRIQEQLRRLNRAQGQFIIPSYLKPLSMKLATDFIVTSRKPVLWTKIVCQCHSRAVARPFFEYQLFSCGAAFFLGGADVSLPPPPTATSLFHSASSLSTV
jgi:hypothetical protein